MATTAQRYTYADLAELPSDREGDRHELFDGELVVTPAPIPDHQTIVVNLTRLIGNWVADKRLGRVFTGPIDVRLTPEIVLEPDLCFVSTERRHIVGPKTIDAAPDLVVEVLSPGTRARDQDVKRALYARFGLQEYWVVDPEARALTLFALRGDRLEPLPLADDVVRSNVVPDLAIPLADVFADL